MKLKYALITAFVLTTSFIYAQNNENLIGTWESTSTDGIEMILDDRGFITFRSNGELMGGIGYNIDGEILRMTYEITKINGHFKITIVIRDMVKNEVLKRDTGTLTFNDPNNIEICFKKTLQESNAISNDCRYFLKIK